MRIWGANFRSPAALKKAATTALNKDKAVRAHKVLGARKGTRTFEFSHKNNFSLTPVTDPPGRALWREKTDKEKSHKGIWRSDAPEASQGQTRDVPGTPGTFGPDVCVNQY